MQTILSTNPFIAWTWCHDAVVNALCHEGENLSQRGTLFSRSFDTQIQVKFMDAQIFLASRMLAKCHTVLPII